MKTPDQVILVDENDREIGVMEKMEAHHKAQLHRAVSVFVFNSRGEWLLQQRAKEKYHSGSLWSNACCTHPLPGESAEDAAHRRLDEEMGMDCPLSHLFSFVYKEKLDNELTEYEYDHVFIGNTDVLPKPNPDEVENYKYVSFAELEEDIMQNPDNYTVWFRIITAQVYDHLQKK